MATVILLDARRAARERQRAVAAAVAAEMARRLAAEEREIGNGVADFGTPAEAGPVSPDPDYRAFQEMASMVRDDALDLVEAAFRWIHDGLAGGDADAGSAAVILLADIDSGMPMRQAVSTLLYFADRAAAEMDAELSGVR